MPLWLILPAALPRAEIRDMESEEAQNSFLGDRTEEELLPTISLINVPHPVIPGFYQRCFEYVERWQWSAETERVETGHWFFAPEAEPKEEKV